MKGKIMNKAHIEKLIQHLETTQFYNQNMFQVNVEVKHVTDKLAVFKQTPKQVRHKVCAAPACIAGHAAFLSGAYNENTYLGVTASNWLELDETIAGELFQSHPFEQLTQAQQEELKELKGITTTTHAITVLKNLLKTGKVNWYQAYLKDRRHHE